MPRTQFSRLKWAKEQSEAWQRRHGNVPAAVASLLSAAAISWITGDGSSVMEVLAYFAIVFVFWPGLDVAWHWLRAPSGQLQAENEDLRREQVRLLQENASLREAAGRAGDRAFWLDAEQAFARIDGELMVFWHLYQDGDVSWNVHPDREHGGRPRTSERFLVEARRVGKVARQTGAPRKFPQACATEDLADDWLNTVAALVDPAAVFLHSGGRDERGDHETGEISQVVEASRHACNRLAAEYSSRW